MTFKELRERSGMTMSEFSRYFGINYRTIQRWEYGERNCPEYLLNLMKYKLRVEENKSDLLRLLAFLTNNDEKDVSLMHNAGLRTSLSEIIEEILK